MNLTVLVATYEWPQALGAVLYSLADQSDARFDVVVCDDGSGSATTAIVEAWQQRFGERLTHVTQADEGYRLARVRNLGALVARGDYLVFLDGDAVPRRHFVRALRRAALPGWFLASKRLELGPALTGRVLAGQLPIHRWSLSRWALERGGARPLRALTPRDRRRPGHGRLADFVPHADGYGFLLGVTRSDFERVNGYDTRYEGWGAEDVDMAVRLRRLGLHCGWPGPQGTVLHLWHEPRKQRLPENARRLAETESSGRVEAVAGVRELEAQLSA